MRDTLIGFVFDEKPDRMFSLSANSILLCEAGYLLAR